MTVLLAALLLAAAGGLRGSAGRDDPPPQAPDALPAGPPVAASGYLDDRACASCHRAIYRSYQEVGMANSFSRPGAGRIIEDFENDNHFFHAPSKRHYRMTRDGKRFFVTRYRLDEDGRQINALREEIDYVIGSGNHSRGYLYQTEAGELFEMPVAWYTQTSRWGMAPGYDEPHHDGFTRPITRSCMFCHNAYPPAAPGSDRYGQAHLFARQLPHGTGCQRCHGPGAEHIRLANDLQVPIEKVIAAITNPARLPAELRDDVCFQCHLQPSSRLRSFVRRFGRSDYSYRPGEPLSDYLAHLDFDEGRDPTERFEINHHPYRLRQSACYVASDQALGCLTCHDPHRKVPPAEVAAHYRDRCLSCHVLDDCRVDAMQIGEIAADDCVTCHMPKRRTQDVVGVWMTDHLIQRRPPPTDLLAALAETPPPQGAAVRFYFPDRAPGGPPEPGRPEPAIGTIYRAISAVGDGDVAAIGTLRGAIEAARPDAVEPYFELGTAELGAGELPRAADTFAGIIERHPDFGPAHANLGVALARMKQPQEAARSLQRALELDPGSPEAHYNLAAALRRLGRNDEARAHYEKAVALRPNHANAHFNLGNLHARAGRFEPAIAEYRKVLAIDPDRTDACRNLGSALRHRGDLASALGIWRQGAGIDPEHGGLALELALAYLTAADERVRDATEGLRFAERAARLAPDDPRPALALALGLLQQDRPAEAIDTARRAGRLDGDQASCLLIMAIASHQLGRPDAGALYRQARAAPGPPDGRDRIHRALLEAAAERLE